MLNEQVLCWRENIIWIQTKDSNKFSPANMRFLKHSIIPIPKILIEGGLVHYQIGQERVRKLGNSFHTVKLAIIIR